MPNWCINFVDCTGRAEDIQAFKKVLEDGQEYIRTNQCATSLTLEDHEIEDGYFFSIDITHANETSLAFHYETKWAPNLLDLAKLCAKYGLEMQCEYEECGMQIYGTAKIDSDGSIDDEQIPENFLQLIEYDEETGVYSYQGEEYDCENDAIESNYPKWKEQQLKIN
jgi:hypothetical protein